MEEIVNERRRFKKIWMLNKTVGNEIISQKLIAIWHQKTLIEIIEDKFISTIVIFLRLWETDEVPPGFN